MSISSRWVNHISNDEDKEKLIKRLLANKDLFTILDSILTMEELSSVKSVMNRDSFTTAKWDLKVAYEIGYKAALTKVKRIIEVS